MVENIRFGWIGIGGIVLALFGFVRGNKLVKIAWSQQRHRLASRIALLTYIFATLTLVFGVTKVLITVL